MEIPPRELDFLNFYRASELHGGLILGQVARRVRAACSPVPYLVALTGYGMPEDRRRTREAGFDDHLVKPLNFELLDRIFEHAVGRNASTRGEAGASARGP